MREKLSSFSLFQRILRDQLGSVSIEYGAIALGIAIVLIGSLTLIGPEINNLIKSVLPGFIDSAQ